jgi:hypothetical protein
MSSIENRTRRDEMQLSMLVNDHSTLVNVCWVNDHPSVRSCALGVHLTRQAHLIA